MRQKVYYGYFTLTLTHAYMFAKQDFVLVTAANFLEECSKV